MLGLTPGFSAIILSLAPQTQFAPSTLTDVCQLREVRSGKTPHLFEVLFIHFKLFNITILIAYVWRGVC